jgi:ankyrin repeat protein|mmetsp:Transcript_2347/g.9081  ORF Transcript_2347/g.9081 Transcript_2347/m.9081 type:complete len:216 (+) Transcript_2347:159-806(+)
MPAAAKAIDLPFVDGTDPIFAAASNGDTGKVKRLLTAMSSKKEKWRAVNGRNEDKDDQTALHVAASRGYMLMATHLLNAGAELLPDAHGKTPLHVAAIGDDKDMVVLLLKKLKGGKKFAALTMFCDGYSRPAAPCHLAKKSEIRKLLHFRGAGDEDGGKRRVLIEGDGRGVTVPKGAFIAAGLAAVVTGLYARARWQIGQGMARPTMRMTRRSKK